MVEQETREERSAGDGQVWRLVKAAVTVRKRQGAL